MPDEEKKQEEKEQEEKKQEEKKELLFEGYQPNKKKGMNISAKGNIDKSNPPTSVSALKSDQSKETEKAQSDDNKEKE